MNTPARILRATAERHHRRPEPTPRQLASEDRILAVARTVMAEHGRDTITLAGMALALRIAASTLRHYFCDLDALLSEILCRHLQRLAYALGDVPHDAPDRLPRMRAAYLAHTRTIQGGFTEAHLLLVRDRHLLPGDLLPRIEALRHDLGDILAYGHAEEVLALLDDRELNAPAIEARLAAITAPAPPAAAPPQIPPSDKQKFLSRRPHPAFEPPPIDPDDDLYRYGRGFRAQPPQPPPPS
jgi:AcrR family transcriptional regulator